MRLVFMLEQLHFKNIGLSRRTPGSGRIEVGNFHQIIGGVTAGNGRLLKFDLKGVTLLALPRLITDSVDPIFEE